MTTKTLNFTSLVEDYCVHHNCYAVYIPGFSYETPDQLERWQLFGEEVKEVFEKKEYYDIMGGVLNYSLIFFDEKESAEKLFRIMDSPLFYSKEYACLISPQGIIDENT